MTDLGPMPEPRIEPGEPNPGGVDAIDGGDGDFQPAVPDLDPDANPAAEHTVPDEVKQIDDDQEEVTSDGASKPEEESPA